MIGKIFGTIFGSDKIVSAGISGIDSMVFTAQEKAEKHLKFLSSYEPFKLAQRVLAFGVTGIFLLVYLNAVVIWNIGVFTSDIDVQGFYMATAFELAEWNTKTLGTPVAVILGFYFMGGVLSGRDK